MIIWFYVRYKFDDERVTKEDNKRALEEQYGGEEEVYVSNSTSNLCRAVSCFDSYFCFYSCHRQIPASITLPSSLQNTPMLTCLFIYVRVTRIK